MVMSAQQVALCCIQSVLKRINDFVLLEQSGELVACAGLKNCQAGGMGEIYALAVSEKAQNQGISTQLLDKIMQKALADNVSKVFALSRHNAQWFLKQGQFQDFLCCIQLCI
jgi:N-acetylglutamate synthase-like GNAT family acetyltransferase